MDHRGSRLLVRAWVALAATLTVLLVELSPLLGGSPGAATEVVLVSLALLAIAAAMDVASWSVAVASYRPRLSPAPNDVLPVLSGPAIDPLHHPLAPRAPGLA